MSASPSHSIAPQRQGPKVKEENDFADLFTGSMNIGNGDDVGGSDMLLTQPAQAALSVAIAKNPKDPHEILGEGKFLGKVEGKVDASRDSLFLVAALPRFSLMRSALCNFIQDATVFLRKHAIFLPDSMEPEPHATFFKPVQICTIFPMVLLPALHSHSIIITGTTEVHIGSWYSLPCSTAPRTLMI